MRAHECSEAFSTDEVFCDRDELLEWAKSVGYSYGFVIVILRSDTWTSQRGRMTYVLLGYERGGKYRWYKKEVDVSRTGNRKCECPFRLRGKSVKGGQGWMVELICGSHNHDLTETMVGYPYARRVVVCDRDVTLMNAIRMVFPEAYNLLCRFHIDKTVKAKCKMLVHPREAWDQVMDVRGSVVDCDIVEAFEDRVNALRVVCSPWPIFVDYVMDTWLRPHKEKIVKAWIDKVMHLGNTTSNRVEATHWSLKSLEFDGGFMFLLGFHQ
ncbi:uncharacterized protein [Phaseolus vulgaris]|uniref:uncharacterized protein n=1 Tax=Phaseolus vulgaris TaxID=3885 RepID=UPI0035C9647D